MYRNKETDAGIWALVIFILGISSWLTHIVNCIINNKILLLLVGALVFPIGMLHGILIWLGIA